MLELLWIETLLVRCGWLHEGFQNAVPPLTMMYVYMYMCYSDTVYTNVDDVLYLL